MNIFILVGVGCSWQKWGWYEKRAGVFFCNKYVHLFTSILFNVEIKAQNSLHHKADVAVCRGPVIGNWMHNVVSLD